MPRTPPWGSDYPPRLFLAVDCGGTSSKAAIADQDGVVLGKGVGGPCNYTDVPESTFLQSVTSAVQMALKNAGVRNHHLDRLEQQLQSGGTNHAANHSRNPSTSSTSLNRNSSISSTHSNSISKLIPLPPRIQLFTSAWFGIAGVDSALDVSQVSPLLSQLLNLPFPSSRLIVANDTSLLASPIHDPISTPRVKTGVVLIAGTGSIVVSFRKDKHGMLRTVGRVGGFGWLLGDEGSGYSVGRNALRAVLDQADRERLVAGDDEFEHDKEDLKEELKEVEIENRNRNGGKNDLGSAQTSSENSKKRQFGHLLRDRILEEWGLVSTDDLLNAVYSSRNPSLSSTTSSNANQATSEPPSNQNGSLSLSPPTNSSQLSTRTTTSNTNLSLLNTNNLIKGLNPSSPDSNSHSPLSSLSLQQGSHSSRSSIEAHSSPQSFNKASNKPDPSSNLLPPVAQPFFGENQPPPPPSSPIPPLTSGPTSRERTPELEESSEEEEEEGDAEDGQNESNREEGGIRNGLDSLEISNHHDNELINGVPGSSNPNHHERDSSNSSTKLVHPIPILATKSQPNPTTSTTTSIPIQSQPEPSSIPIPDMIGERKHRLASLAPLVFHLAFSHEDELSLSILKNQIKEIGDQVIELVRPSLSSFASTTSNGNSIDYLSLLPKPETSVLCLGGSLLGVTRYRALLGEYLESKEIRFARMEFVNDPSKSGACALAGMWKDREVENC